MVWKTLLFYTINRNIISMRLLRVVCQYQHGKCIWSLKYFNTKNFPIKLLEKAFYIHQKGLLKQFIIANNQK